MPDSVWPLHVLRVVTPRLELRSPREAEIEALARLSVDIHDPATMPFRTPWSDVPSPALERNTMHFRKAMTEAGFDIRPGVHPIVPIMLYNAKLAQDFARDMYAEGIYVIGFFFPVVPQGQARIRVQISADHEREHLDKAIGAFTRVGGRYNILGKKKEEIIAMYGT